MKRHRRSKQNVDQKTELDILLDEDAPLWKIISACSRKVEPDETSEDVVEYMMVSDIVFSLHNGRCLSRDEIKKILANSRLRTVDVKKIMNSDFGEIRWIPELKPVSDPPPRSQKNSGA